MVGRGLGSSVDRERIGWVNRDRMGLWRMFLIASNKIGVFCMKIGVEILILALMLWIVNRHALLMVGGSL